MQPQQPEVSEATYPVAIGDCPGGSYPVAHMDSPGGPLERNGVEVEEADKGHAFDEMWGITKRG